MTDSTELPARDEIVAHVTARPEGLAALEWAVGELREKGLAQATLHVVLSGGDHQGASGYFAPSARERIDTLIRASGIGSEFHDGGEDPVGTVLSLTERIRPRLVVTGVRRRSKTMKFLLGSNSQRILLEAEAPVVAVKAPEDEED